MANKKDILLENESVEWGLDDIMSDRFGRYSKYIIQERALPDARDGLKPVQRRILYAMEHDGNTSEKPHRKSAKTVGLVIGTYHPHGDSSVYDAMVRMSQDWKMNVPLVDMHGNNGSQDDDPPAAMRYTEARLSKFSVNLLNDIHRGTVPFTNNYDDTELEPTVLPASLPLLLVNGATGIASGYATNIAPHNLEEVIEAAIYRLRHEDCSLDALLEIIHGPDFPTGGIVQGAEEIRKVFAEGKGKVVIRSRAKIEETRTIHQIVITEIPYEVVKSELVKRIDAIRLNKELDGILDVRDESGREGIRIVVDVRKESNPQLILNYLFKNTDLQVNYNYNMIAIDNHRPVLLNLLSALDAFILFRKEVVLSRSKFLLEQKSKRMHLLEGLIKAISILDDVMEIIRSSKDKADSKIRLREAFLFSEEQAEAIVMMRLYRLSSTDITLLREEYAVLGKESNELRSIIASEDILKNVIIHELRDVKMKHPCPRRTSVEEKVEEIVIRQEEMIANERVFISVTGDGYLRRYSERVRQANSESLPAMKEGDYLLGLQQVDTLDTLLLFSDKGNYLYIPVYKLEETKWKEVGVHASSYVKMTAGERIVGVIVVKSFRSNAYVMSLTAGGMVKKTPIADYQVTRSSKELTAMKLKKDDCLCAVGLVYEGEQILIVSRDGYYTRYSADVITPVSVAAQGVIAMNVKGDEALGFCVIRQKKDLLLLTETSQGKRIHIDELEMTSRAVKGYRLFKQRKTDPYRVKRALLSASGDMYWVIDEGERRLLSAGEISLIGKEGTFGKTLNYHENYVLMPTEENFEIVTHDENYVKTEKKVSEENTSLFEESDA